MSTTANNKPRLRDLRKPGHLWIDNEVLDVYGPEIGQNGISVYATLARYCYGNKDVRMGLRELAERSFMKKDTVARAMKLLVATVLVIEVRARAVKSASSYALADVKELVRLRAETERRREMGLHDLSRGETDLSVDKNFCPEKDATELSQVKANFETDLSQNAGGVKYKTQDIKKQDNPPLPPKGAAAYRSGRLQIVPPAHDCPNGDTIKPGACAQCDAFARGFAEVETTKDADWQRAVDLVVTELGTTNRRVRAAIDGAMLAETRRRKQLGPKPFPAMLAQEMISEWKKYLAHADLMRYQFEAKRFFAEGIWRDQRRWPWDEKRIEAQRRARAGT